jgi:hypothetical protein
VAYLNIQKSPKTNIYTFDDLLDAIEQVESGGDPNAIGTDGEIGSFQITKIYVDDVNRILGGNIYSYDDRRNKDKSRNMVCIYIDYWAGIAVSSFMLDNWAMKNLFEELNYKQFEIGARIHNGGPNGWKKESTKTYWEKIERELKEKQ